MPDTDSPPDSYTERNQTGHNKDPKSHSAYLHTRVQVPPPDYSPLPSVIIFSAYTTHIVKDIVQKRLLVTVMRVKRNSADLCLFTEFRNRNVFKIFDRKHSDHRILKIMSLFL